MQGIYNYIPETSRVSRVYSVAAVPYLQSVLHVMLFHLLLPSFCATVLALVGKHNLHSRESTGEVFRGIFSISTIILELLQ
jgi:hypothetical protein